MSDLQSIKNRFGIIGNFPALNRAIEKAIQVALQIFPFWLSENLELVKNISRKLFIANLAENINHILW